MQFQEESTACIEEITEKRGYVTIIVADRNSDRRLVLTEVG